MTQPKSQSPEYLDLVERTAEAVFQISKAIPRKRNWACIAEGQVRESVSYSLRVGYKGYMDCCDPRPFWQRRQNYYKEVHYKEGRNGRINRTEDCSATSKDAISRLLWNAMIRYAHDNRVRILTDILNQTEKT
jgi:hypothetical protein